MKQSFVKKYKWTVLGILTALVMLISPSIYAAGPPVPSEMSKPMAQVLVVIIVALLLVIALLANVVIGAADLYLQRYKELKKTSETTKIVSILVLCFFSSSLFAQDAAAVATQATDSMIGGLSSSSFYALMSVIGVEVVVLFTLLYNLKLLLAKEAAVAAKLGEEPAKGFSFIEWWDKFNSFRPAHEEASIDLGHDYDGIRELDNRLPPWWLYGFYLCILVAGIYLYRYHVAHSAPLSKEEFQIAMNDAAIEKEEYLKKSANKVDENTVVYLSDATSLGEGKKIFTTICAACHLADGGGAVGPNLTDDYWLHGGGIKDIFKTIKYGWPEKGMKSWKDDYTPVQIAQLASYVKSLHGTKPGKPKEPQGVLYEEKAAAVTTDSTKKTVSDSAKVVVTEKK
jgi:cytochrome c oxidase cbb3-type subunit 3